jgi:hypothetical protein
MTDVVVVALISLAGTGLGTFGGIITATRLSNYRIEQLEKKVDKHNCLIDRMYKVEARVGVLENGEQHAEH